MNRVPSALLGRLAPAMSARNCSSAQPSSAGKKRLDMVVEKTPKGRMDDAAQPQRHRDAEKEPLPKHPKGVNALTGEAGGPAGPDPTRYGDWERKGRCVDF